MVYLFTYLFTYQPNIILLNSIPCVSQIRKVLIIIPIENPNVLNCNMSTNVPVRYPSPKNSLPIKNNKGYPKASEILELSQLINIYSHSLHGANRGTLGRTQKIVILCCR